MFLRYSLLLMMQMPLSLCQIKACGLRQGQGELIFTGEIITADEAKSIGLVNVVVSEPEHLISTSKQMAQKIISKAPVAVSLAKFALNMGSNTDIHSGLLFEKFAQTIAFST